MPDDVDIDDAEPATVDVAAVTITLDIAEAAPAVVEVHTGEVTLDVVEQAVTVVEVVTAGPQGPPGQPADPDTVRAAVADHLGPRTAAVWAQTTPAGTWIIPHQLGRTPAVTVYDSGGQQIHPDVHATTTVVTLVYAVPTAGTALLT